MVLMSSIALFKLVAILVNKNTLRYIKVKVLLLYLELNAFHFNIKFSKLRVLMLQNFWRQNFQCSKRFLLSTAYDCSEEWRKRLEAPIFKNVDTDEFITDLRKQFLGKKVASPIDLDVAVNLVQRKDHLDELKSCIYKIRHTKMSASILPSTHHALVRSFLHLGCEDLFMEMIDDPDKFSFATKIACHMMKQEEFRLSTCWLSVYSCLKWLFSGDQSWITIPCTFRNMNNEEEEDLIFKIPYLKNPVFDDHFDLEEPRQLVGKTILWMSEHLPDSPAIHSCRALGLKLWNKHDRLVKLLKQYCETSDLQLHADALDFMLLDDQPKEEKDQTEKLVVDQKLSKLVNKIKDSAHFTNDSLEASFFDQMNKELPELEKIDISEQIDLISSWNQSRIQLLENKVRQIYLKKRLAEIAELRKKLTEEREVVFFFENKATWENTVHPDYKEADVSVSAGKLPSDDEYVVPELEKRTVDDLNGIIFTHFGVTFWLLLVICLSNGTTCDDLSECLYMVAHEPTLGLYRIEEHIRKSVPALVEMQQKIQKMNERIEGVCFDINNAITAVEDITSSMSVFNSIHENLRSCLRLKQQLDFERNKRHLLNKKYRKAAEDFKLQEMRKAKSLGYIEKSFSMDKMTESIASRSTVSTPVSDYPDSMQNDDEQSSEESVGTDVAAELAEEEEKESSSTSGADSHLQFYDSLNLTDEMENSVKTNAEIQSETNDSKAGEGNATGLRRSSRIKAIRERQLLKKQQESMVGLEKLIQLKMKKLNAKNANKSKSAPAKAPLPLKGILKTPSPKRQRKTVIGEKRVTFA
ncbi:Protein MEF2BNB -like protein [Trichinella murrelli]|uniref:Protein MEF2BNB-like protein n=1 Tax=Trichinella murrelli TaxID=144512 RepID=A0A0V0UBN2_9BILA|nr:Protein MEF2BNB -like protein [Trichinella murrelli]